MGNSAQTYFSRRLEECRELFDKGSAGFLRFFGIGRRPSDGIETGYCGPLLQPHYNTLLNKGRVAWGCVAQVNFQMFVPGEQHLPGVTAYSTDAHYDANPQDLLAIARACFQFKNTEPSDSDFQPLAARLTDEYDSTLRMVLPPRLTDGRTVFLGATLFHRVRLPEGVLRASLFPLLIATDETEVNMLLPLRYWSQMLRDDWPTLDAMLADCHVTSAAPRVAELVDKPPPRRKFPHWDTEAKPIFATQAMAETYRSIQKDWPSPGTLLIFVMIRPDGTKHVEPIEEYDRHLHIRFESNGVPFVIRKDQKERLAGLMMDYQNNVLTQGIVFRELND
jgi:hypothetical protein